ncbi:uncharacterized protein LOC119992161 [Tripterygium wilfordii]|nr:uncharacterized protein LOC119992161 [Tripterygium wilfordii]
MGKKSGDVGQRAWDVVRLALLWARKGGVLRLVPKYFKNLGHADTSRGQIFYQERELSFDKTPIFHLKTHRSASMRFLMSCISPQVDFESYDFNGDDGGYEYNEYDYNEYETCGDIIKNEEEEEEEEGIDVRAEKFIAQFYEQMRTQR